MNKVKILEGMNNIIKALNNEEAYYEWIVTIPDEADEDDIKYCAEDEEIFTEAVEDFKRIMKHYLKDGFYIDKKLY